MYNTLNCVKRTDIACVKCNNFTCVKCTDIACVQCINFICVKRTDIACDKCINFTCVMCTVFTDVKYTDLTCVKCILSTASSVLLLPVSSVLMLPASSVLHFTCVKCTALLISIKFIPLVIFVCAYLFFFWWARNSWSARSTWCTWRLGLLYFFLSFLLFPEKKTIMNKVQSIFNTVLFSSRAKYDRCYCT